MCNHLIDDVNTSSELTCSFLVYFPFWCQIWKSKTRVSCALCDDCELLVDSENLLKILVSLYLKQACKLYDIYLVWIITGMRVFEWKKRLMNNIFLWQSINEIYLKILYRKTYLTHPQKNPTTCNNLSRIDHGGSQYCQWLT